MPIRLSGHPMRSTVIRGAEGLFLDYVSSTEIAGLLLSADLATAPLFSAII
jgi:hypothetical protein